MVFIMKFFLLCRFFKHSQLVKFMYLFLHVFYILCLAWKGLPLNEIIEQFSHIFFYYFNFFFFSFKSLIHLEFILVLGGR